MGMKIKLKATTNIYIRRKAKFVYYNMKIIETNINSSTLSSVPSFKRQILLALRPVTGRGVE
jgi:hypothetical protein